MALLCLGVLDIPLVQESRWVWSNKWWWLLNVQFSKFRTPQIKFHLFFCCYLGRLCWSTYSSSLSGFPGLNFLRRLPFFSSPRLDSLVVASPHAFGLQRVVSIQIGRRYGRFFNNANYAGLPLIRISYHCRWKTNIGTSR